MAFSVFLAGCGDPIKTMFLKPANQPSLELVSSSQTIYRMLFWKMVWQHTYFKLSPLQKKKQSNQIV